MSDSRGVTLLELATTALVALPIFVFSALLVGGAIPAGDLTAEYFTAAIGTVFLALYALALTRVLRSKERDAAGVEFPSKMFALAMLLVSASVTASGAWVSEGGVTLGHVSLYALQSLFAAWVGYRMVTAGERRLANPAH